jgi:hypothetical protein
MKKTAMVFLILFCVAFFAAAQDGSKTLGYVTGKKVKAGYSQTSATMAVVTVGLSDGNIYLRTVGFKATMTEGQDSSLSGYLNDAMAMLAEFQDGKKKLRKEFEVGTVDFDKKSLQVLFLARGGYYDTETQLHIYNRDKHQYTISLTPRSVIKLIELLNYEEEEG